MNLKDLEFRLSQLADAAIFGDQQRESLQCARDVIAEIRAANNLPPSFDIAGLASLIAHKSRLPERPQAIVRLPSSDSSQYDRFAVLPAGLGTTAAIAAANAIIARANKEDHDSQDGTCADGDDVESNVRRGLEALGFIFLPVETTSDWDEYTESGDLPALELSTHAPHETSAAAESRWEDLCNEQGWNDASQVLHLEGFLRDNGLFQCFVSSAEAAATEENAEARSAFPIRRKFPHCIIKRTPL